MLKDMLKLLREEHGLTKKQLANEIGIKERAYLTYEYGQRDVSTELLQKFADFYGVTTDYLLGRPDADTMKDLKEGDTVHWYETLKLLREKSGKSMSKTAEFLGIPKGTYASYEYGKREPNIEMISKISNHFGVTTDYLLANETSESQQLAQSKEVVKQLRKSRNLTMREVAEKSGISYSAYTKYEYGERELGLSNLKKLADFYGVTTDYLLGREPAPERDDLSTVVKNSNVEELEDILIRRYLELPNAQRQAVLDFLRRAIQEEADRQGITLTKWETVKESAKNGSGT